MDPNDFSISNIKEDDDDYIFESPMMRVWEPLTGNHTAHIEHIFPRFTDRSNTYILNKVKEEGEGKHWTPQTLSFMRSNVIAKRMLAVILPNILKIFPNSRIEHAIDATANVGGESIQMAMSGLIDKIKSYEPDPKSFEMLKNNITLYTLANIITPVNKKFDYDIPPNSLVLLDPPFQSSTNIGNFGMSIEGRNLHYIIRDILAKGSVLILNTPKDYKLSSTFLRNHSLCAACYRFGNKNVKVYCIMSADNFKKAYNEEFASFEVKGIHHLASLPTDEEEYKKLYAARAVRV